MPNLACWIAITCALLRGADDVDAQKTSLRRNAGNSFQLTNDILDWSTYEDFYYTSVDEPAAMARLLKKKKNKTKKKRDKDRSDEKVRILNPFHATNVYSLLI
jgi:hypothetical protein